MSVSNFVIVVRVTGSVTGRISGRRSSRMDGRRPGLARVGCNKNCNQIISLTPKSSVTKLRGASGLSDSIV